jgi:thymidylate kinase
MLLFLEGPDGGGKTNLSERLSGMYNCPIAKFSYPKTTHEKRYMFEMYSAFIQENSGKNLIVDRCWYSEMVYGPIIRHEHNMSKMRMYELEKLVMDNGGGMIVHCTDSIAKLWKRFSERGDDYIAQDFNLISQIKKNYDYLMHKVPHNIPVFRYEINENLPRL